MSVEEDQQRYLDAMHGVQSAIAFEQSMGNSNIDSHKHLRVGIDSAHVSDRGLADLLIAKGVFTREEYVAAMAHAAETELAERQDRYPGINFR